MIEYATKITALYSRLSVGDEDRDGGESNSIAINNGIDSKDQNTLEFAPFINIMSEWYARDISKKVTTGIKTKGANGKPVATEAPYGYIKDPNNKDYWIVDKEAAEVVKLIFTLFMEGKNRNQIAVYLKEISQYHFS